MYDVQAAAPVRNPSFTGTWGSPSIRPYYWCAITGAAFGRQNKLHAVTNLGNPRPTLRDTPSLVSGFPHHEPACLPYPPSKLFRVFWAVRVPCRLPLGYRLLSQSWISNGLNSVDPCDLGGPGSSVAPPAIFILPISTDRHRSLTGFPDFTLNRRLH